MEENIIKQYSHPIPAYSALYHCVNDSIFTKGKYAYKILKVFLDNNGRNKEILNPERLREKLFREIMWRYNERINHHNLLSPYYQKLTLERKKDLKLEGYHILTGMENKDEEGSGFHMVYPRTFVCKLCGDMQMPNKDTWQRFNPLKCNVPGCDGEYEQISLMMFCEDCGKVKPLQYSCGIHKKKSIRLLRGEKDALRTWKVVCKICYDEKNPAKHREPVDIFRLTCNHKDDNGNIVHDGEKKFKPLTIKEGGIYTPVVLTSVDIQETNSIDIYDLEYILLALHLGFFSPQDFFRENNEEVTLEDIVEDFESYRQERKKIRFIEKQMSNGQTEEEAIAKWKKEHHIDIVEDIIEKMKSEYNNVDLERLNDYLSLRGKFTDTENETYSNFIASIENTTLYEMRKVAYSQIKEKYGIQEIIYLPRIKLVSSCIGLIHGINKFWEDEFIAHFEPIWQDKSKKDKMISYSYPFETEGILLELDKIRVVNWLIDNEFLMIEKPNSQDQATRILLKIEKKSDEYAALKSLIHTLSHVLIKRSSMYTGLDGDSCSEILFPNSASILIYSTSNINIGGFAYIFENSIPEWFNEISFDMKECTFDPTCIHESGSCFSCLYLPEYVCSEFNHSLDRDAFNGYHRFKVPYW